MAEPSASDLSVVIPTRERWQILDRTLAALASQTVTGFETVVVVDGTEQAPAPMQDVRLLVQPRRGPGAARNAGMQKTSRPLLLFLGDDMVPDPGLVAAHLDAHRRHRAPEDATLGHVEWHPEVPRNRVARWLETSGTQFDYHHIDGDEAGWGRFYSCNVSLKRAFLESVGGFDEDFTFDYEDLDLAFRLHEKGLRLWYEPRAIARHLHPYDLDALARRYESRAEAEHLMARKHPWFSPYFGELVRAAAARPRVSPWWLLASDVLHRRRGNLATLAHERTGTWFHQHLAPRFLARWEGEEDLADLRAYLGDEFDLHLLWGHRRAVDDEELGSSDEATFYRTSRMYLYDLTAFAMSGIKRPYLATLCRVVPQGATVLDYGCGIGSDGLRLLERGYRVAFADFDNPSTRYLRWRLERRGLDAPVYDLDGEVPGGFDVAFAFDVIEHVEDPFAFLEELERRARIVAVNVLEPDPEDTHLHRPLPVRAILDRATRLGLLRYRRHHSNSHLLVYRTDGRSPVRSRSERLSGLLAYERERTREKAARVLTR